MKATFHEHARYMVSSESGNGDYLVDLLENRCDCDDHRIRVQAKHEKEECKHLPIAFEQFGRDMIEQIRKTVPARVSKPANMPTKLPFRSK